MAFLQIFVAQQLGIVFIFKTSGYNVKCDRLWLGLTSLASLAQDETFQSLASLARLFLKVSQNIILFFGMFLAGNCFRNTWNSRFWRKLSHKNAIKIVWGVIFKFMPTLTPRLVTIRIFFSKNFSLYKKFPTKYQFFQKNVT